MVDDCGQAAGYPVEIGGNHIADPIAFAPSTGAGMFAVSDRGGEPKPLTEIDPKANEAAHRWPQFLPGGAVLFTVKSTNLQSFDDAQIMGRSLDSGEQHAVAQGVCAKSVDGHVVYARAGALYAVRFDVARLAVIGAPVKVANGVITHPESGGAQLTISRTGTPVYAAGDASTAGRPLLWVDRSGTARTVSRPAGAVLVAAHFSGWQAGRGPHRRRFLEDVGAGSGARNVHAREPAQRGPGTRGVDAGRRSYHVRCRYGGQWQGPSVHGQARWHRDRRASLFDSSESPSPLSWSPDGRRLLYRQGSEQATTGQDVWVYSARGSEHDAVSEERGERVVGGVFAGRTMGSVRV